MQDPLRGGGGGLILTPQSHAEGSEMKKGGWRMRPGFNLLGPSPLARPIRLPPPPACSGEVPSFNCNHKEASQVRDVLGRGGSEEEKHISLFYFSFHLCRQRGCLHCNKLGHKLRSIHPISGPISVSVLNAHRTYQLGETSGSAEYVCVCVCVSVIYYGANPYIKR